jgi:hypothetical protein
MGMDRSLQWAADFFAIYISFVTSIVVGEIAICCDVAE